MTQISQNAGLVIIDVQKGFDHPKWGPRNKPGCRTENLGFAGGVAQNATACFSRSASLHI
jgi:hypothetical protein